MKRLKYVFLIISVLFVNIVTVSALSCSSSDNKKLNQISSYIKADYEVIDKSIGKEISFGEDKTTYSIPNYLFEISLYNLKPDVYVEVKNNINDETIRVIDSMANDGIYTFVNDDFGKIYNYTITIYSNLSECYGEKVRTLKITKPRYNAYSGYAYCKNSTNLYCQKFVTQELNLKGSKDFFKKINVSDKVVEDIYEEETKEEERNPIDMVKDNWRFYAIVFSVVVILMLAILLVFTKRKNRRELDL